MHLNLHDRGSEQVCGVGMPAATALRQRKIKIAWIKNQDQKIGSVTFAPRQIPWKPSKKVTKNNRRH
jgi:hypothetical protein